ncbi:hypothetical protein [Ectobacillus polymachus]|uniref:hypothetical protein n=1 Tax=Ectobacillus polymachus TaxID=1508806 RepID=UPI003A8A7D2C
MMKGIWRQFYTIGKFLQGGTFTKGPKPFTNEDRKQFLYTLQKILSNHEGIL